MSEDITIVYPATVDWYLLYNRPQQLLTAFAKRPGVRSIFVTTESFRMLTAPIVELAEDLYIVRQYTDYSHLLRGKKVFWFTFPPHYRYLQRKGLFDLVVFDAIDNPEGEFAFWKRDLPAAIKYTDVIVSTAQEMYNYHASSGKPLYMNRNAADYEHFSQAANPQAPPPDFPVRAPDEKIVGFYGALSTWIDYGLIRRIAERYKVVLIGDNKFFRNKLVHPRVISLPHKDYEELPRYLAQFDAACIPFVLTNMIKGCDPPKFYEYIAAGKPVLATRMNELTRFGEEAVYFIDAHTCHQTIERALAENTPARIARRMEIARENTWEKRADEALAIIHQHLF
ncbi:glycosyltransferase family protein [Aneurinibacillus sp. REN35]|uniref:glycosyltransferase family protein n=2 Tax=Paenibacillaceae TaxID=186822 RepID=UPI003527A994